MYGTYEELIKEKIEKKKQKIEELTEMVDTVSSDKITIETKRKKSLRDLYIKRIEEDILLLKREIEELNKSLTDLEKATESNLLELGMDIDSKDVKFLNTFIFYDPESDFSKELIEKEKVDIRDLARLSRDINQNKNRKIEKIEDLIMVHKTNFLPINGVMYTARETHGVKEGCIEANGKKYEYEYEVGQDTLHFTLNGPVSSHFYGNWDDREYAIIVPFDKVNKENLLSCNAEDTYFQNHLELPEGSMIVCPKSQKEKVQQKNPNVKVIGYEPDVALDDAVNCIIAYTGRKIKEVTNNGWAHNNEEDKLRKIKEENGIVDKEGKHIDSRNIVQSRLYTLSKKIIAFSRTVIDNDLALDVDIREVDSASEVNQCGFSNGLAQIGGGKVLKNELGGFFLQFQKDLLQSGLYVNGKFFQEDMRLLGEALPDKEEYSFDTLYYFFEYLTSSLISMDYYRKEANKQGPLQ